MRSFIDSAARREWFAPAIIALAAFVAVVSAIDPAGDYPDAPQGPGLTIDEIFNVQEGARLVEGWKAFALGAINLRDLYGDEKMLGNQRPPLGYHFKDHPPLGRMWLGVFHHLTRAIVPPRDHETFFVTACARVGSAAAFALTVYLVGLTGARWYGFRGGVVAAIALVLMPRVYGHAHIAALESTAGLAYLAAILVVASRWPSAFGSMATTEGPTWRTWAATGAFFGFAMLTKIQGILIPPAVALWALFHWRMRAIRPLMIWGLAGLAVFFVGWPWLWFDPLHHFLEYLGRTTDRMGVNVWYLGQKFADRDVPWHFPAVMFATTVPVGLHLLGLLGVQCGARPAWKEPREQALLAGMLFPIALFSYSSVVVYDGERLFLVSFLIWALLIGRGGASLWSWLEQKLSHRTACVLITLFLLLQGYGVVAYNPNHLSYYNLAVGGLRGADRLGFERTYWGESLTREFLEEVVQVVPEGARIDVVPVLHRFQLLDMLEQSPLLRKHQVRLVPFDSNNVRETRYLLFFHRFADLPDAIREGKFRGLLLEEVRCEGIPLAALYEWDGFATGNSSSAESRPTAER
ncbi:MAG: ArnT family glycosyltransferase [Planctomycetaceae bacterium]